MLEWLTKCHLNFPLIVFATSAALVRSLTPPLTSAACPLYCYRPSKGSDGGGGGGGYNGGGGGSGHSCSSPTKNQYESVPSYVIGEGKVAFACVIFWLCFNPNNKSKAVHICTLITFIIYTFHGYILHIHIQILTYGT